MISLAKVIFPILCLDTHSVCINKDVDSCWDTNRWQYMMNERQRSLEMESYLHFNNVIEFFSKLRKTVFNLYLSEVFMENVRSFIYLTSMTIFIMNNSSILYNKTNNISYFIHIRDCVCERRPRRKIWNWCSDYWYLWFCVDIGAVVAMW